MPREVGGKELCGGAEESHVLKRKAVVVLRGPFRRQEACPREAPYLIDGKADQLGDFTGRVH